MERGQGRAGHRAGASRTAELAGQGLEPARQGVVGGAPELELLEGVAAGSSGAGWAGGWVGRQQCSG